MNVDIEEMDRQNAVNMKTVALQMTQRMMRKKDSKRFDNEENYSSKSPISF